MRSFPILLAFLPFLPALNLVSGADLHAIRLLIPAMGIIWFIRGVRRRHLFLPFTPPVIAFAAFLALAVSSVSWAVAPAFALRKSLYFLSLSPTFVLALTSPQRLASAIALAGTLSAAVGLSAFFAQFLFGHAAVAQRIAASLAPILFGVRTAEAISRFPSWYVDLGLGHPILRAFLPFPDPHTAALFWVIALAVALFSLRTPRVRVPAVMVMIAAIAASFSRGGYVALLAMVSAYGVLRFSSPPHRFRTFTMGALTIVALALFGLTIGRPFALRFLSTFNLSEGSNALRIMLWRDAFATFAAHPLVGVGLGGFAAIEDPLASYRTPTNAHSTYLEIAAELGALGIGFFLAAVLSGLVLLLRRAGNGEPLFFGFALGLCAFAVHAIFEVDLYGPANFVVFLTLLTVGSFRNKPHL
jgi:O-antigen ligase